MTISTTLKKVYFNEKMKDLKESDYFIEYKEAKPFWNKRLEFWFEPHDDVNIVFLVGSQPHRFRVVDVWINSRENLPKKYQDAIKTEFAWAIKCVTLK